MTEIAEHLKVRQDTIYSWIENRGLPAHRVGRFWRFKLVEVDEWVRSGLAGNEGDNTGSDSSSKQKN